MYTSKKIVSLVLVSVIALGLLPAIPTRAAVGDTFNDGGLSYRVSEEASQTTVTVLGLAGGGSGSGPLYIPASVMHNGQIYDVTAIGDYSFTNCTGFTGALTIPNTVTSIGEAAFRNCIGLNGTLIIPDSVKSIDFSAFCDCTGFTAIKFPDGIISIGASAFVNCTGLTGALTIPNSITTIGGTAFQDCTGFTALIIPDVTSIDHFAFRDCFNISAIYSSINDFTNISILAFSGLLGKPLYCDQSLVAAHAAYGFTNINPRAKSISSNWTPRFLPPPSVSERPAQLSIQTKEPFPASGRVTKNKTTIYGSPSSRGKKLLTLGMNDIFSVLGVEGGFFKVQLSDGQIGYVDMKDTTTQFAAYLERIATWKGSAKSVWSYKVDESGKLVKAERVGKGTNLNVLGRWKDYWMFAGADGNTRFIAAKYA